MWSGVHLGNFRPFVYGSRNYTNGWKPRTTLVSDHRDQERGNNADSAYGLNVA